MQEIIRFISLRDLTELVSQRYNGDKSRAAQDLIEVLQVGAWIYELGVLGYRLCADQDAEGSIPIYTKKTKIPDKVAALSLAMRHLGMLKDKMEHSGPGGLPLAPPTLVVNFPEMKKP